MHTVGLQLRGTQKAAWRPRDMRLVAWQGLGTQLARLQEEGCWAPWDRQLQVHWQVAELHTGRHSRAAWGAQQELPQPRGLVEQLAWHMVAWGWSGIRAEGRLVCRLLPGVTYTPGHSVPAMSRMVPSSWLPRRVLLLFPLRVPHPGASDPIRKSQWP